MKKYFEKQLGSKKNEVLKTQSDINKIEKDKGKPVFNSFQINDTVCHFLEIGRKGGFTPKLIRKKDLDMLSSKYKFVSMIIDDIPLLRNIS